MIEDEDLCAVAGCPNKGRAQVCPYDGRLHGHGRIHYDCGFPPSRLPFRDGWRLICDDHFKVCEAERRAAVAAKKEAGR